MNCITVNKNEKRTIVKIEKDKLYSYAWLENNEFTIEKTNFQEENTILNPTKEELQELFPTVIINTEIQRRFDNRTGRVVREKCTMII